MDSLGLDPVATSYAVRVTHVKPSVALSMLALWERPWSTSALRWAAHILQRAYNHGCDVLEHAPLTSEREHASACERNSGDY
jgi:hypothetical protein